jgi:glycosyl transferase family 25
VPQFGAPAFAINLARTSERRRYIEAHLAERAIAFTVLSAVDGRSLSYEQVSRDGIYEDGVAKATFSRSLSLPEIGCTMSHLEACRRLINSESPFGLVIEDDAYFADGAAAILNEIVASAPADWGIIQLRCDCKDYEMVSARLARYRRRDCLPVAATAYLITREAATRILAGAYPISYPADSLLGRAWKWDIVIYGCVPDLVGVNNIFPSAIQTNVSLRYQISNLVKALILRFVR